LPDQCLCKRNFDPRHAFHFPQQFGYVCNTARKSNPGIRSPVFYQ
jgi:hypothetical protein